MKRFVAALALLCCLLLLIPTVLAEPAAEETEEITAETDSVEETPLAGEDADESLEEEVPTKPQKEEKSGEKASAEKVDPLSGVTCLRRVEIISIVNKNGEARISQTIKMEVYGVLEEITFAFPAGAKNRVVEGYRTKSSIEDGIRYLTVRNKSGFGGEQVFNLSYTLKDLVSAGEESQKLTLPLLEAQKYPVGVVALAVNLPETFASMPRFSSGYYGELIEDYMTINTTATAVTATVNDILQDSDSLTMHLTVQEGYFSGRFGSGGGGFLRILALVLALIAVIFWWKGIRHSTLRVHSRTLPPDGVNPGDVPFLLSGGKADFNLLVSHWATLGYLSFYVNKSGHVILRRRMSMGNERRTFERKLFDLLFGEGELCDGASIRYQKVGQKAEMVIPRYWMKRLYNKSSGSPVLVQGIASLACGFATMAAMDAAAPEKLHGLFLLLGLIAGCALGALIPRAFGGFYLNNWKDVTIGSACALLLLILGGLGDIAAIMAPVVGVAVFLAWRMVRGGRPSDYGEQVFSQTLGFRRFLLHADVHHLLQMLHRDPQYFYKILPYAEAMGQGRRFVAAFQDVTLEPCQWFESAREVPMDALSFYDRYLDALDMLNISLER